MRPDVGRHVERRDRPQPEDLEPRTTPGTAPPRRPTVRGPCPVVWRSRPRRTSGTRLRRAPPPDGPGAGDRRDGRRGRHTRAARDAGEAVPVGPFTRHAIEGFRRTAAAAAPTRRGQARGLHAAISPEPGDSVVGLGVDQINRRFAAACAAAGLEGQRTSHGCRVGLAVELTARGASHACHPTRRRLEEPRHWSFATPRPSARAKEPSAGPFKPSGLTLAAKSSSAPTNHDERPRHVNIHPSRIVVM